MTLLHALDLLSTFVFALVGARVAADRGLDYGGIAFIATVASISGGTLRNLFLGFTPVWISDPWILASILSAVIITLTFRRVTHVGKMLLILDTFALATATLSGTQLAYELNVGWYSCIVLGIITAVTGGLIRDVLCQVEPVLLHRETIGTSAAMGAATFVSLHALNLSTPVAVLVGGAVVVLTRVLSIQFDLHLPKFVK
ncbi:MAG: trimeric intracellular cation channel family protein [Candidatus Planktophila sp.]